MIYIQSFYQYPVTFSSAGVTIPARYAEGEMRNIAEVTEKQYEKIKNCEPFFRELVTLKKFRVLNHLPESYKASAVRINEAQDEISRLRAENERLRAQAKAAAGLPEADGVELTEEEKEKLEAKKTTKKTSYKK